MKNLLMHATVAMALVCGLSGAAFADDDAPRCGVRTLHGRYVFSASGFTVDAVLGVVPKAIIEVIDFNGDGTLAYRVRPAV